MATVADGRYASYWNAFLFEAYINILLNEHAYSWLLVVTTSANVFCLHILLINFINLKSTPNQL